MWYVYHYFERAVMDKSIDKKLPADYRRVLEQFIMEFLPEPHALADAHHVGEAHLVDAGLLEDLANRLDR